MAEGARQKYGSVHTSSVISSEIEDGGALLSVGVTEDEGKSKSYEPRGVFGKIFKTLGIDEELGYTLLGVLFGIILGFILSASLPTDRTLAVRIVGFPGAIFLNLLKMMVLPLISGSMVAGVCALNGSGSETGRMARNTLIYFAITTIIAVILGLILVTTIRPGVGGDLGALGSSNTSTTKSVPAPLIDTIFGVMLQMFPPNVLKAAVDMNVLGNSEIARVC
jgi:L-cystine uptake protein TcyP (sodium:dicarboxylate symporter family)